MRWGLNRLFIILPMALLGAVMLAAPASAAKSSKAVEATDAAIKGKKKGTARASSGKKKGTARASSGKKKGTARASNGKKKGTARASKKKIVDAAASKTQLKKAQKDFSSQPLSLLSPSAGVASYMMDETVVQAQLTPLIAETAEKK